MLQSTRPSVGMAPPPFGIPALLGSLLFPPKPGNWNPWELSCSQGPRSYHAPFPLLLVPAQQRSGWGLAHQSLVQTILRGQQPPPVDTNTATGLSPILCQLLFLLLPGFIHFHFPFSYQGQFSPNFWHCLKSRGANHLAAKALFLPGHHRAHGCTGVKPPRPILPPVWALGERHRGGTLLRARPGATPSHRCASRGRQEKCNTSKVEQESEIWKNGKVTGDIAGL